MQRNTCAAKKMLGRGTGMRRMGIPLSREEEDLLWCFQTHDTHKIQQLLLPLPLPLHMPPPPDSSDKNKQISSFSFSFSNSSVSDECFELAVAHEDVEMIRMAAASLSPSQTLIDDTLAKLVKEGEKPAMIQVLQAYASPPMLASLHRLLVKMRGHSNSSSSSSCMYLVDPLEDSHIHEYTRYLHKYQSHAHAHAHRSESQSERMLRRMSMQMWLNDKFMDSIFCRRKLVIHHMLRRGAHAHYPSQQIINDAFIHLVTNNDFSTASLLMQQDLHGVNEAGFNLAFHELFAYREVDYDALDWLLSGRQGFSVQQEAIDSCLLQLIHISLFRKHSYHHQRHHPYTQQHTSAVSDNVISRLSCRASEETRQMIIAQKAKKAAEEKAPHVFRHEQSMDIHAFSAVEIPHPPSASAAAEDQGRSAGQMVTRNTLNAACLDVMKRRIANYREMNADEVLQSLTQLITQYLHPNQYDRAMEIIGNVVSTHTIKVLSLALQFLSSFSSEAASVWIQGFLNESIVERSCQAGAVERIVTGLRGVGDAELNSLFSNAEGVHLARIFLKTKFNIFESTTEGAAIAQQNSEELAWILVSNGFRDESSNMGMAQRILTDYAMNCIRSYGVEYVQLSGEVDSVIEVIMDTYDTHLKAYVLAASSSTAAMHEDDDKQQVDEAKKNHNEYK